MSATDALLANARAFAAGFDGGGLPGRPARRVAIVTCMDARIDPAALLGLAPGDANVIRNAGGIVTDDVIRSLTVSQRLLGTREVILIQHTRCGMMGLDDGAFRERLAAESGTAPAWPAGGFADLEASLRGSIARIRDCPFLVASDGVRGVILDVDDGSLREVPGAGPDLDGRRVGPQAEANIG